MPLLTEILQDINYKEGIVLDDESSLLNKYEIEGEEIQGFVAVSRFISETFERNFKTIIENIKKSDLPIDFKTGPEDLLDILYKTKVVNEVAFKYKLVTKNKDLTSLPTWEDYLKPNIFKEIIKNQSAMRVLTSFNIDEYMPKWRKENQDKTFTTYKYTFYSAEKEQWQSVNRIQEVKFQDGYIVMKITMPVKEEKVIPEEPSAEKIV
jgi:hypothetical protein